ncbi:hypothetical protein A2W14_03860 [Candidatus Gottesmanbacteria bacterium RBG_16_37_8]|uniref:PIN domain-containing protein n=1 Tax=Candidatus Gottesmanbacteria bacterium RBG_16_37_8 TaxID=1798371 RepID=A0A1F5YTU2_9BACT|nr:MAG: hypothetical protein A2W14_03860 [Candidatus Gottesmanbacteria bacterium RBG_16_37_8]
MILLDTTIIVDFLRGDSKVGAFLNNLQDTPTISLITEAEIYQGAKNTADLKKWENFISKLKVLPVTLEISLLAINLLKRYYLSHGLHILDALIAATAFVHHHTLVTSNTKHFQMIKDLDLKPWPLH